MKSVRAIFGISCLCGAGVWTLVFALGLCVLISKAAAGDELTAQILEARRGEAVHFVLRLCWFHLCIGTLLGLLAAVVLCLLDQERDSSGRRACRAVSLHLGVVVCVTLLTMSARPVLLDPWLNLKGGVLETLQTLVCFRLSPHWIRVGSILLLLSWLLSSAAARRRLFSPRFLTIAALIGAAVALVLNLPVPRRVPKTRPNVLIAAFDSLRADHLSIEGYGRATTPAIDAVARRGLRFHNAFVPLARTLPSWASFLTSMYPHTHGIRNMFPAPESRRLRVPTLPEVLRRFGYRSFVVSDYAGESFSLVDFGFDASDTPPPTTLKVAIEREIIAAFPLLVPFLQHRVGHDLLPILRYQMTNPHPDIVTQRTLDHVDLALDELKPFFATVFYSGPHTPYAAPYPGYRRFAKESYRGANKYAFSVRDLTRLADAEADLPPEEVLQIRALYDGCIRVSDEAFGELLRGLERRGVLEDTIVVVTADHGEHLYEYGNAVDHGKWFRGGDAANRVPLVIAGPGFPDDGRTIEPLVGTVDLMPTLLHKLEIKVPVGDLEGVDLSALIEHPEQPWDFPVFAETGIWLAAEATFAGDKDALIYPPITRILYADSLDDTLALQPGYTDLQVEAKHRMLRRGAFKLVYEPTIEAARWKLYDVNADPGNEHDLSVGKPEVLAAMKRELLQWMALDPARTIDSREHVVRRFTYFE